MISDSLPWKKSLLSDARWLASFKLEDESFLEQLIRLEKRLLISFYVIRKLLDTFKVTDNSRALTFELAFYPCVKTVDYLNCHRVNELYNLSKKQCETRDIQYVCNQFIHSYVFSPLVERDGTLQGIYVSSDKVRQHKVYFVTSAQIRTGLLSFGNDDPTSLHMCRNDQTGQWEGGIR